MFFTHYLILSSMFIKYFLKYTATFIPSFHYLTDVQWNALSYIMYVMSSSKEACLFMCVCLSFSLWGYTHIPCIFVSCFLPFNFSRLLAHLLFNSSLHDFWTDKKFHIKPSTWHLAIFHLFFNIVTWKRKEHVNVISKVCQGCGCILQFAYSQA